METLRSFENRAQRDAAFAAYDALAREQRQRRSIEQRAQELERVIAEAPAAVAAAENAVRVALDAQLRGLGSVDEALRAKERVVELGRSAAAAREEFNVVRRAKEDADERIRAAKAAAQRARDALSASHVDAIAAAVRDDGKLRRRLVLAFAAVRLANDRDVGLGGSVDWVGVLGEIFPLPTDAEFEEAYSDGVGRFPKLAPLVTEASAA